MRDTYLSVAFTVVFSAMMFAIGVWMGVAPRSYLSDRRSLWRFLIPSTDPESRSIQFACRLVGIGIIIVIALYDYTVLGTNSAR